MGYTIFFIGNRNSSPMKKFDISVQPNGSSVFLNLEVLLFFVV